MSWNTLHPDIRHIATTVLTPKQLDVWKLHLAGLGARRISDMLGVTRSTIRSHLHHTHTALEQAGVHHDASGRYYQKEAA